MQNASRNQRKRKRLHATQAKIAYDIDVTQSCKCPVKETTPAPWDIYFLGKHWHLWALVSLISARFGFINRSTKIDKVYCIVLFLNRNCNFAGHYSARRGFKIICTIVGGGGGGGSFWNAKSLGNIFMSESQTPSMPKVFLVFEPFW